jgi:antitoxin CptB
MDQALDTCRKRLLFRSWHRGTREMDLLLGSFAEHYLPLFAAPQLEQYAALLECPDADLWDWIVGNTVPAAEQGGEVLRLLLDFRYRANPA